VVLLLNNYTRTGIGDFGLRLEVALKSAGVDLVTEELAPQGERFFPQLVKAFACTDPVIANIGLTSWGPSPMRNLIGFLTLGVRAGLGRTTVVILHNIIEAIDPADAGYRVTSLLRFGAHQTVRLLARCKIVVLSSSIEGILRSNYRISPALATLSPCPKLNVSPSQTDERFTAVTIGYLAPYKGLDLFVEVAEKLKGNVRFIVVGTPHRVLSEYPAIRRSLLDLTARGKAVGVEFLGYVPEPQLAAVFGRCSVGVLAYRSTSGGSASAATLAGAGLPIVACNLPDFRALADQGGALILTNPDSTSLAEAILELKKDCKRLEELRQLQLRFAEAHGWDAFGVALRDLALSSPLGESRGGG
jgi:glycosyltransferase involved in cell wall biosynthesis